MGEALAFLHGHGIVHCDVKEPNLMIKTGNYHKPEVVLIDFGVAQKAASADRTVIYGTPGYIAPEVWDVKTWCPKGDMFSLGVVFLQLLIDRVPSSSSRCGVFVENTTNFREVRTATQTREIPFDSMPCSHTHLREFVEQMLERDPSVRPSAADLLCDGWISMLDEFANVEVNSDILDVVLGRDRALTCQELMVLQPGSPHGNSPSAPTTVGSDLGGRMISNASTDFSNVTNSSFSTNFSLISRSSEEYYAEPGAEFL